jgi:hypothetical protein
MGKSKTATRLVTIWAMLNGAVMAGGLFRQVQVLTAKSPIPLLGLVPVAGLVLAGIALAKRQRGARVIATVFLSWTAMGALRMVAMRLAGTWPYAYSARHQYGAAAFVVLNAACLVYLWRNRGGNPYSSACGADKPIN